MLDVPNDGAAECVLLGITLVRGTGAADDRQALSEQLLLLRPRLSVLRLVAAVVGVEGHASAEPLDRVLNGSLESLCCNNRHNVSRFS